MGTVAIATISRPRNSCSFRSVKVYPVMPALWNQVINDNCPLSRRSIDLLENPGRKIRLFASTDETFQQRFDGRAPRTIRPKALVNTVTVSSNLLQISRLGNPFLSKRPYTDSQAARPSMSLRVEAKHKPRVSWNTSTRGDRKSCPAQRSPGIRANTCVVTYLSLFIVNVHDFGADFVTTRMARARLQRVYRLNGSQRDK